MRLQEASIGYTAKRGEHVIAQAITASLAVGHLTALIGPNGAGKSTLIKTLAGFLPPLKGDVLLKEKPIRSYNAVALAREISVVLTEPVEVAEMTVSELVAMGRSPYTGFLGRLTEADNEKILQALEWVGISALSQRRVTTLSDGERQKVMIAKALAQETPVIMLDEPTAFLDFPSKVEVMLLLKQLAHEQHKAILLSTHDLEIALQTTDELWVLDTSRQCFTGTPQALAADGTLSRIFSKQNIFFNPETLRFDINHPS